MKTKEQLLKEIEVVKALYLTCATRNIYRLGDKLRALNAELAERFTAIETTPLKKLNTVLFEALNVLHKEHCNNITDERDGFKYSENRYGELNDLIDELQVNYFDGDCDGDYGRELKEERLKNNEPLMSDEAAHAAMIYCLTNFPV